MQIRCDVWLCKGRQIVRAIDSGLEQSDKQDEELQRYDKAEGLGAIVLWHQEGIVRHPKQTAEIHLNQEGQGRTDQGGEGINLESLIYRSISSNTPYPVSQLN